MRGFHLGSGRRLLFAILAILAKSLMDTRIDSLRMYMHKTRRRGIVYGITIGGITVDGCFHTSIFYVIVL